MNEVDVTSDWDGRWRYPGLFERDRGAPLEAVLEGIASPMGSPAEAFDRLLEKGEFEAADQMLGFLPAASLEEARQCLAGARGEAAQDVERTWSLLRSRARLAAAPVEALAPARNASFVSRAAGAQILQAWERQIANVESARAAELGERLLAADPEHHPEWAAAVQACLDAGEYPSAADLLDRGPGYHGLAGPAGVPLPRGWWPWQQEPATVLGWYRDEDADRPRDFVAHWLPPASDRDAWQVVDALARLHKQRDAAAAQALAGVVDSRLLGAEDFLHPVAEVPGGWRTVLHGLSDKRLPWLVLPRPITLTIGADGVPGYVPPGLLLVPDRAGVKPVEGVAVIDQKELLQLVALDRDNQPLSAGARCINLLRYVCRQVPARQLAGGTRLGRMERIDGAWLLDLAGLEIGAAVVDVLLHDTGGQVAAVGAAVEHLAGRKLDLKALDEWRRAGQKQDAVRDAMREALGGDPEVGAIVLGIIWNGEEAEIGASVTVTDALLVLETLGATADPPVDVDPELLNIAAAMERAVDAGLMERDGDSAWRLRDPGLAVLLGAGQPDQAAATMMADLQSRRAGTVGILRPSNPILRATAHYVTSQVHGLRVDLAGILMRRAELDAATIASAEAVNEGLDNMAAFQDAVRSGQPEPVLLRSVLKPLVGGAPYRQGRYVEVELRDGEDATVIAERFVLQVALANVLNNAVEAALDGEGSPRVAVALNVGEPSGQVSIDFEDSGSGIPDELRLALSQGHRWSSRKGPNRGRGLVDSIDLLRYLGGELEIKEERSTLGGAWLRVRLQLRRET